MTDFSIIPEGKDWVDIAAAFFPIIISFVAVYFTYVQFKLAEKKREDDLFDRRFDLYNRTIAWTQAVSKEYGYTEALSEELALILREGQFLYDKKFYDLIVEADEKFRYSATWKKDGKEIPGEKWPKSTKEKFVETKKYFAKTFPEKLFDIVSPYLRRGAHNE